MNARWQLFRSLNFIILAGLLVQVLIYMYQFTGIAMSEWVFTLTYFSIIAITFMNTLCNIYLVDRLRFQLNFSNRFGKMALIFYVLSLVAYAVMLVALFVAIFSFIEEPQYVLWMTWEQQVMFVSYITIAVCGVIISIQRPPLTKLVRSNYELLVNNFLDDNT